MEIPPDNILYPTKLETESIIEEYIRDAERYTFTPLYPIIGEDETITKGLYIVSPNLECVTSILT